MEAWQIVHDYLIEGIFWISVVILVICVFYAVTTMEFDDPPIDWNGWKERDWK